MQNRKFSTSLVAIVIAFLSIYAVQAGNIFTATNNTTNALPVTLGLQSTGHVNVNIDADGYYNNNFGTDKVVSISINGGTPVPAGTNAVVKGVVVGTYVKITWSMQGTTAVAAAIDPYELG